jgi:DNA-binding transcriptional ArsR family regulator
VPDHSDVFAAVASPVRRELLGLLLDRGPLPVQQLAVHFAMSRPSVSEHLKVLKDAGLVREQRSGRHRYYQLDPQPLQELAQWLNPYERFWRQKLTSLRDLLDEQGGLDEQGPLEEPGGADDHR